MAKRIIFLSIHLLLTFFCLAQEKAIIEYDFTENYEKLTNYAPTKAILSVNDEGTIFEILDSQIEESTSSEQDFSGGYKIVSRKPKKFDRLITKKSDIDTLFVKDRLGYKDKPFEYYDVPFLEWHISEETTEILDYNCQKATANFRGRDYEVWFTNDLGYNSSMWKFVNLPGVILKAKSLDGIVTIEATKIILKSEKDSLENTAFMSTVNSRDDYSEELEKSFKNHIKYLNSKFGSLPNGGTISLSNIKTNHIETDLEMHSEE